MKDFLPPSVGLDFRKLAGPSADPRTIGVFFKLRDVKAGQPCGTTKQGKRTWLAAYVIHDRTITLRHRATGEQLSRPDPDIKETLGKWYRDLVPVSTTDATEPKSGFQGHIDMPRGLRLPVDTADSVVQGQALERTWRNRHGYAVAIVCECAGSMIKVPLDVFYISIVFMHHGPYIASVSFKVDSAFGGNRITDWSEISGLKQVDDL